MSSPVEKMKDIGVERTILSIIMAHGRDAFIDVESYLDTNDFTSELNRTIYHAFKDLASSQIEDFDPEVVKTRIKSLKKEKLIVEKDAQTYISMLTKCAASVENTKEFCRILKKHSLVRELYKRHQESVEWLAGLKGDESINDIMTKSEEAILAFLNGANIDSEIHSLTGTMDAYIKQIIESEIVDQIGIPTGFPIWDELIGGGIRPGTVNFIVARPKVGKSWDALNKARNITKLGIPVLYLDSELTEDYQKSRILGIDSGCPISLIETGRFKTNKDYVDQVIRSGERLKKQSLSYQSIAGLHPTEVCSVIRRWISKTVGFNESGKANPCAVVYDYLKLTSGQDLTKTSPEYLLLGLMMTDLSNLAIRYGVPIVAYGQCNREGIESDETSVVAGSDRILWLCANLTLLKNKTEDDVSLNCGFEHGNKKIIILETRHGSGHAEGGDYINIKASLRPGVSKEVATGLMVEGLLYSQIRTHSGAI